MAWRIESQTEEATEIIIDGWDKGSAPDPYSGINRMYAVNLATSGEVSVGYTITANATSGATLGTPIADSTRFFAYGSSGYIPVGSAQSFAILDTTGFVFESTSITGTFAYLSSNHIETNAGGTDGLAYWMGYLWKTRGAAVDYWTGSAWVQGWAGLTLTAGVKHFMLVASDNVLYITNGNYVASVSAPTPDSFDPTNSATYATSATKLRLPTTDMALSLAEVGAGTAASLLLIGGTQNAIYPWDKVSSSFKYPIYVADSYIKLLVSVNQNVFIFPGNQQGRGRIYITNGSQADLYFKMPDYLFGEQDPYYVWGDAIFHRNNLIFGCFVNKNSGSGTLLISEVFAIDLDTKAFRAISDIPTNATGKGNAVCLISTVSLSSPGFGYVVAWDDNGSAPGIGYSGTTAGIGSASIITDLIPIGTFLNKGRPPQVEYKLRSVLQSGESITVTPIVDGTSTTALTFTPAVAAGQQSGVANPTFQNPQWVQFQIALTGNSATSGCRLYQLRMRI